MSSSLAGIVAAWLAACALATSPCRAQKVGGASSVDTSASSSSREWSTCRDQHAPECGRGHYVPADSRLGLGLTLDYYFLDQGNELFIKDGLALSYGALVTYDVSEFARDKRPIHVSLDVGYRLQQYSSSYLFGGEVTSAITTHQVYVGSGVRMLSAKGPTPALSYHARVALGLAWGPIELRDARERATQRDGDSVAFLDLAFGLTIRLLGLVLEAGHQWCGEREFRPTERAAGMLRIAQGGFFARSAVVLRLP